MCVCLQCGTPGFDPWVGKIPWRRKWQPTPVFLPGKSRGLRILVGYSPWGRQELDTTERLHFTCTGDTILVVEREEELKSLLVKVKEESKKAGLKFTIQKAKIVTFSPTTSWQIDGETIETVADFIFLGSKITVDGDCSHEIKRQLLLRRKVMTKLVQFSSVTQSCPTLCHPVNHSMPGLPVHHQLPEFTQTHVHRVSDAIQPSHPLSSPSPPTPNPS